MPRKLCPECDSRVCEHVDLTAPFHLSQRCAEVALYVGNGLPNKVIGGHMNISEGTVKAHLNRVFIALGLTSRFEVAIHARANRVMLLLLKNSPAHS